MQEVLDNDVTQYYASIFPFELFSQWIEFGNAKRWLWRREFAFSDVDNVLRFQAFKTIAELRQNLLRVQRARLPRLKLEIGAIYENAPNWEEKPFIRKNMQVNKQDFTVRRGSEALTQRNDLYWGKERRGKIIGKELVFDLDLPDMSAMITTNKDDPFHESFHKSWRFAETARQILECCMRNEFGFQRILTVFSGMKGFHCWITDERAMLLDDVGRVAIMKYITLSRDSEGLLQQFLVDKQGYVREVSYESTSYIVNEWHPFLESAVHLIRGKDDQNFTAMIEEQEWFSERNLENTLRFLQDKSLECEIKTAIESARKNGIVTARGQWGLVKEIIKNPVVTRNKRKFLEMKRRRRFDVKLPTGTAIARAIQYRFILSLAYPIWDSNVTNSSQHLLKAPFSVHPKTGLLSLPILAPLDMDAEPCAMLCHPPLLLVGEVVQDVTLLQLYFDRMETFCKNTFLPYRDLSW